MSLKIARVSLVLTVLVTISLSLWKSLQINHVAYLEMENYIGGAITLHFTFSFLIGSLAVFAFPRFSTRSKTDAFGLRLLLCLLLIISAEEFSQLFVTSRTFSFDDLSTNWTGMLVGYLLAKSLRAIRNSK